MHVTTFSAHDLEIGEVLEHLGEMGYAIITDALHDMELQVLKRDLEPHFEKRANSQALFFGFNTKRIEALLTKSSVAQRMVVHPPVMQAVEHVLGPHCDHILLNLTQGIRINPGEEAQLIHPDSALFPIENKPFEFQMNAIWAYSDFTKENGATQIVPGSHKWGPERQPEPDEIISAEMPAGSVLIYAASLLHGGGANITDKPRTGIAISYCLGWLRQSENQYLSYPPEIAKGFSEEIQTLLGYRVHRPNLGWVHGHEPIALLKGEKFDYLGAEDFLTEEQQKLMREYRAGKASALTSHNYKEAA